MIPIAEEMKLNNEEFAFGVAVASNSGMTLDKYTKLLENNSSKFMASIRESFKILKVEYDVRKKDGYTGFYFSSIERIPKAYDILRQLNQHPSQIY